jgi:hypothetical protein
MPAASPIGTSASVLFPENVCIVNSLETPAHRNPTFDAELSGVFELRAATRYRLQYDLWHRNEPPFITLAVPVCGPWGFCRPAVRWNVASNQSPHHSHAFPVIEYSP